MVQSGGSVMKNVAGYDLTRLQSGGFGAFGVIVLVHLRLRTLPRADVTYLLEGAREDLTQVGEDIAAAGLTPAALELVSPALARRERWVLGVRLAGSPALVAADEEGFELFAEVADLLVEVEDVAEEHDPDDRVGDK